MTESNLLIKWPKILHVIDVSNVNLLNQSDTKYLILFIDRIFE